MEKKRINLALQGGGAHGAFTWGLLDKFLEKDIFEIEGISATSAGSMNAVVLAQGMLNGGKEGARELLHQFWHSMSEYGECLMPKLPIDLILEPILKMSLSFYMFSSMSNIFSPYQFNPSNFHPIQKVLEGIINFEQVKNDSKIKLFICATNVKTGKIRIFTRDEICMNAILASACLPKLFQAVEVDNEYYWDGGYLGDPAIFPLIYNTDVRDIIILQTVPIVRETLPNTVMEIDTRLREISFNSSLMREMRAISFVTKLITEGWMKPEYADKLKKMNLHSLRADHSMEEFSLASVYNADWGFLTKLRDLGREAAEAWLDKNYDSIGKEGTVDFNEWL